MPQEVARQRERRLLMERQLSDCVRDREAAELEIKVASASTRSLYTCFAGNPEGGVQDQEQYCAAEGDFAEEGGEEES